MATQRLTVAKISGISSEQVFSAFRAWEKTRLSEEENEWGAHQWPSSTKDLAHNFAEKLKESACTPPVTFFVEYADLWSFCPASRFFEDYDFIRICSDRYDLFCLKLPLPAKLFENLKKTKRYAKFDEDRLFAHLTLEAEKSWSELCDQAVLIFLRESITTSVLDEEMEESFSKKIKWI